MERQYSYLVGWGIDLLFECQDLEFNVIANQGSSSRRNPQGPEACCRDALTKA